MPVANIGRASVTIALSVMACLGLSGCSGVSGMVDNLFDMTSGSGNAQTTGTNAPDGNGAPGNNQGNGDSHVATENDKLAFYERESDDGEDTVTSVLHVTHADNGIVDIGQLKAALSDADIDWYQAITKNDTGANERQGAYVYLPSGLGYEDIVWRRDRLAEQGYDVVAMTPDAYREYQEQRYNLYYVEMCYMGPAAQTNSR